MRETAGTGMLTTVATDPLLLLKDEPASVRIPGSRERAGEYHGRSRIRCPRCSWEPGPHDRWMCLCLHVWNTFDTRGVCPACAHKWLETECLRCMAMSLHEDWYVQEPGRPF